MVNRIELEEPSSVHVGKLHVIAAGAGIRDDIWNLHLQFKIGHSVTFCPVFVRWVTKVAKA